MTDTAIGIVVPTMGTRNDFLRECVQSIRAAGQCTIVVVRPADVVIPSDIAADVDHQVDDPCTGLAGAINEGVKALPEAVEYVNWLGDDDRLTTDALTIAADALTQTDAVCVFGQCRYINTTGAELWVNRSGRYAVPLLHAGPQLIPQPGALYAKSVFIDIGMLNTEYKWAFDLQMFLDLKARGKLHYINHVLAEFRWHPDSLSVGGRHGSVTEASRIRVQHLPRWLRPFSKLWEPALRRLILVAGARMNDRMSRQ